MPRESIIGAVRGDRGPLRGYYAEINNALTTVSDIKLWSQGADTSTSERVMGGGLLRGMGTRRLFTYMRRKYFDCLYILNYY